MTGTYTLSDGTRAIIAKLPEPVTLRFYFSKKNSAAYPVTAAYAKRVRDLLGEYAALSHGKIVLEDVDPEPFTPEEDEANAAGIRRRPPAMAMSIYFGAGRHQQHRRQGSYSLSGASNANPIWNTTSRRCSISLSHPEKPKLAILSCAARRQSRARRASRWPSIAQLRAELSVTTLAPDFSAIPAGTNLLLIAHPENVESGPAAHHRLLPAAWRQSADFRGPGVRTGPAETQNGNNSQATPQSSDLPDLLKGLGVDYSPRTWWCWTASWRSASARR